MIHSMSWHRQATVELSVQFPTESLHCQTATLKSGYVICFVNQHFV